MEVIESLNSKNDER